MPSSPSENAKANDAPALNGRPLIDPLLAYLFKNSALTERQMEVLLTELDPSTRGMKMSEKARLLGVTKGTYAKVLQQALRNLSQSVFTVLVMGYLGLHGQEGSSWIVEVAEHLRAGRFDEALDVLAEIEKYLKRSLRESELTPPYDLDDRRQREEHRHDNHPSVREPEEEVPVRVQDRVDHPVGHKGRD
ncbi:MAG: hypothetical protein NZ988_02900 [Thaumarchaeota archaeon]|nr:hypothetical protein [Candidatus Calditenuaceae archaeon]MDW8186979.1 hypothetical protein [Nitrososphaerota archaeon]